MKCLQIMIDKISLLKLIRILDFGQHGVLFCGVYFLLVFVFALAPSFRLKMQLKMLLHVSTKMLFLLIETFRKIFYCKTLVFFITVNSVKILPCLYITSIQSLTFFECSKAEINFFKDKKIHVEYKGKKIRLY